MSAPVRKVALKPAHGLSVRDVLALRRVQSYWQRILELEGVRPSSADKARSEIAAIERRLGHG